MPDLKTIILRNIQRFIILHDNERRENLKSWKSLDICFHVCQPCGKKSKSLCVGKTGFKKITTISLKDFPHILIFWHWNYNFKPNQIQTLFRKKAFLWYFMFRKNPLLKNMFSTRKIWKIRYSWKWKHDIKILL
jgi:hypothetical protein